MGSQAVKAITSQKQRKKFIYHLLSDVKALEKMISDDLFEKNVQRIGAEQELCIVNKSFRPSTNALKILNKINDPHFTTELALFNLEINLDPEILENKCFSTLEKKLISFLFKANKAAEEVEEDKILLTGILPTLKKKDLIFEKMTPFVRYKTINQVLKSLRGDDFKLHIRGVDELILNHKSVLFEACNTSFQVHLQIGLDEIVDKYNWSQAIAGPILSVMTNSPMLLGRELWSETRIALFQQSIDMRNTSYLVREQKPRVSFGNSWIKNSILELFTDDISRYSPILTTDFSENSFEVLEKGILPQLKALNLFNGTLYKWNRVCYGVSKNSAHLRIENRYIPSGPSIKDEVANAVFWIGVMQGMPDIYKEIWKVMPFKDARGNFLKAARTGIDSYFNWFGKGISASKLIKNELIPMARVGLKKSTINKKDIEYYLTIIEKRIDKYQTGSKWMIRSNRKIRKDASRDQTNILLAYHMYKNQQKNIPIHAWDIATIITDKIYTNTDKLYKVMTTELFVIQENDLVEMVQKIMEWKNIRHLPVVDKNNKLIGLITSIHIENKSILNTKTDLIVAKDIMIKKVITATPETFILEAKETMKKNAITCLPIIENEELIGIFTKTDLLKTEEYAKL